MSNHDQRLPPTFPCVRTGPAPAVFAVAALAAPLAAVSHTFDLVWEAARRATNQTFAELAPTAMVKPPFGISREVWDARWEAVREEKDRLGSEAASAWQKVKAAKSQEEANEHIAACKDLQKRELRLLLELKVAATLRTWS
ncbi:hypothetical protein JCM10213_001774 [Rhodosporidiobolus nylandii]